LARADSRIQDRCWKIIGSTMTKRASGRASCSRPIAWSKSSACLTPAITISMWNRRAPSLMFASSDGAPGFVGLASTPGNARLGISSRRISICLTPRSGTIDVVPVTLPPGCERLAASPEPTGSAACAITIGMVLVTCRTARVAAAARVTMTSGLAPTVSCASCASRRGSASA
jgi:hypothetical protein